MNKVAVDQCRIRSNREKRGIITPLRRSSELIPSHDRKKDPDGEHHTRQEPRRYPGDRTVADLAPVLPAVLDQDLVSLGGGSRGAGCAFPDLSPEISRGLMPEEGASESQTAAPVQPTISHAAAKMAMLRFQYRFMAMLLVQIDGRRSLRGAKNHAQVKLAGVSDLPGPSAVDEPGSPGLLPDALVPA